MVLYGQHLGGVSVLPRLYRNLHICNSHASWCDHAELASLAHDKRGGRLSIEGVSHLFAGSSYAGDCKADHKSLSEQKAKWGRLFHRLRMVVALYAVHPIARTWHNVLNSSAPCNLCQSCDYVVETLLHNSRSADDDKKGNESLYCSSARNLACRSGIV